MVFLLPTYYLSAIIYSFSFHILVIMAIIGVTDSGAGGLSVLKALYTSAPENKYIYLADTANSPYGGKSREEIIKLAENSAVSLLDMGADIVVLACNTATSAAADYLKEMEKNIF